MYIQRKYGLVIAGGGPAGIAVLLAAHRDGTLNELLERGVLIVERGASIGGGLIGSYCINSDSTGNAFIDPLRTGTEDAIHRVLETPVAQRLAAAGLNTVSLKDAGEMLRLVGEAVTSIIQRYPQSDVATGFHIQSAQLLPKEGWKLTLCDRMGALHSVQAENLVLATGASQPYERLSRERFAGMPLVERWGERLLQSGDVFAPGGLEIVSERLRSLDRPSVAILGGSTSAMALACALLKRLPEVRFREAGITLFHRRPLRVYYTTVEEALADGYTEFGPDDICPLTKRVFRLAGLRLESRELLMQLRGIGGRPPEPRMRLHLLQNPDPDAVAKIDSADLVIAALGYRPNAVPLLNERQEPIRLLADTGPQQPMVDDYCRVMDSAGAPLPRLFGIGLAAGFVPSGKLGGERSFTGQANGLWLWQNDVGAMIVNAVLGSRGPASVEDHSFMGPFRAAGDHVSAQMAAQTGE